MKAKHDTGKWVWHCSNRLSEKCNKHNWCRGTECRSYTARKGSCALSSK